MAVLENCSPLLKLYNSNCELTRTIKSPDGFVTCAEHVSRVREQLYVSSVFAV